MRIVTLRGIFAAYATLCLAALAAPVLQAQETKEKVTVDDVDREFTVRLPRGYDAKQHYPVVILLHGMNQDADDMERLTRFDELADKNGIIAIYPTALHGRWNVGVHPQERPMAMRPGGGHHRGYGGGYPGGGGGGGGYPGGGGGGGGYPGGGQGQGRDPNADHRQPPADDVAFLNQMLDQVNTKFSVDSSRVYTLGLSEGGFMSLRAACSLGDRIAAAAAVGAAMPKTMICLPSRPVPVLLINGTSDPVVPYGGGTEKNLQVQTLSAEDSSKDWAKIDRCNDKPEKGKWSAQQKGATETKTDTYDGCRENAKVVLYSLKGVGNTWPGGEQYEPENAVGKTSTDVNANEVLWSFLKTQKLPDKTASAQ
jgi:polyhydroxybutyrate depolymerase